MKGDRGSCRGVVSARSVGWVVWGAGVGRGVRCAPWHFPLQAAGAAGPHPDDPGARLTGSRSCHPPGALQQGV
jgi:hypothetical protein